jgi:uncharacterized protein YjbI with pentapeptide repeats
MQLLEMQLTQAQLTQAQLTQAQLTQVLSGQLWGAVACVWPQSVELPTAAYAAWIACGLR